MFLGQLRAECGERRGTVGRKIFTCTIISRFGSIWYSIYYLLHPATTVLRWRNVLDLFHAHFFIELRIHRTRQIQVIPNTASHSNFHSFYYHYSNLYLYNDYCPIKRLGELFPTSCLQRNEQQEFVWHLIRILEQ